MVEAVFNSMMDRYDLQIPYQLGDIKGLETVAHYERKDNMLFFVKALTVADIWKVTNKAEELKAQIDRSPLEDLEREKHFELDPDGQG